MNINYSSVIIPSSLASLYPDIQTAAKNTAILGAVTAALPTSGQLLLTRQVMEVLPSTSMAIGH